MSEFKPGLHIARDPIRLTAQRFKATSTDFPRRIDHRCELLESSDQGETSECAAFAMAGAIEYERWKWDGVKGQVDPHPIYIKAKELDGIQGEGTTLEAVVSAANLLGLLPSVDMDSVKLVSSASSVMQAIHRYDVVLAGFEIDDGWMDVGPDGWIRRGTRVLGGHAELLCGYADDDEKWFAMQGSWGSDGYGWRGFVRIAPELFAQQFVYGVVWDYAQKARR